MKINLTVKPEVIQKQPQLFLYLEKTGPFMVQAPKAWQEFHEISKPAMNTLAVTGMSGLSRIDESRQGDAKYVYQAGVFLAAAPAQTPKGLELRTCRGGKYARFVVTGSYNQLPQAYPQIFSILEKDGISLRDEFCAEIYLNTPQDTAEDNLKTEILIPITE